MDLAPALREWHDFYMLGGTASATLIGLMFVAASIGAGFYNERHAAAMGVFVTPTVVHLGSALVLSLVVVVPTHTWMSLGALLLAGSVIGIAYSARVSVGMRQERIGNAVELIDRLWYGLTPLAGYLVLMTAAAALLAHWPLGLDLVALALGLLLLLGIRNAWDMTVWMLTRLRSDK